MGSRVRFVGAVDPSRVPELYRLADVFVSASRTETQGLTFLEALASGVPVVCRDDAALDGVVVAGRNGQRCTTPEEFTRSLTRLLQEPDLRRWWGRRAVRTAAGLGRQAFASAVCAAYDQAAGPQRAGMAA